MSVEEDSSIDVRKVLRYDYLRKDAIHELESATFNVEYWSKLEDREKDLREHVKNAANRLQELLKLLGHESKPQANVT